MRARNGALPVWGSGGLLTPIFPYRKALFADAQLLKSAAYPRSFGGFGLSDTPALLHRAPDCVSANLSNVFPCTYLRSKAVRLPTIKAEEIALAQQFHVTVIDPVPWFCDLTRCPVIVGNILLYRDNAHMVPAYSQFIAPVLKAKLFKLGAPAGSA